MKIWVVYNEGAGYGVSSSELAHALEHGGHTIVAMVEPNEPLDKVSPSSADLVVVAGGDGTVRRIACSLARRGVPLALLPMGTANNIATSLGVAGPLDRVIASWDPSRRVPFDLCLASGVVQGHFMESIGGGLIAEGIETMDRTTVVKEDPEIMMTQALVRFREVLKGLKPRRCTLTIDGESVDGDYLLVEVLNIPAVGPAFRLSHAADPSDGAFDVVFAGEAERAQLDHYLRERVARRPATLDLPSRRASSIALAGWDLIHADDEIRSDLRDRPFQLRVVPAAIDVLVPVSTDRV